MRVIKDYCDHCGKVLDNMNDYCDTKIEVKGWYKCDLCNECITELDNIVKEFCKKGGAE